MTEITSNGAGPAVAPEAPDPELVERAQRRRYSAEYKLRIVREADACTEPG
jgi:transposase